MVLSVVGIGVGSAAIHKGVDASTSRRGLQQPCRPRLPVACARVSRREQRHLGHAPCRSPARQLARDDGDSGLHPLLPEHPRHVFHEQELLVLCHAGKSRALAPPFAPPPE